MNMNKTIKLTSMHHNKEYFIMSSKIVYFEENEFAINSDDFKFMDEYRKDKIIRLDNHITTRAIRTLVQLEDNKVLRVKETPEEIIKLLD